MDEEIITFGNIETEKNKFYHHKSLVFNKISSDKKDL